MRKFSVSLLVISFFMFALCGCAKTTVKNPVIYFSANAEIHTQDISMTAKVSTTLGNNVNVSLLTPKPLSGLYYQLKDSTLYIGYNSLKCNAPSDYLSHYNPICVMIDTLSSLDKNTLTYQKTENKSDIYSGKGESGEFTLYVDSQTGYVTRIIPKYTQCDISFTNVTKQ